MLFILYVCLLLYVCLFVCLFVFGCCRGVFVSLFGFCLVLFSSVLGLNVSRSSNMYYKEGRKEIFILFPFILRRSYGKGPLRQRERGNPLSSLRGQLFSISSIFAILQPFVTPVVEHWLEREIVQCFQHEGSNR